MILEKYAIFRIIFKNNSCEDSPTVNNFFQKIFYLRLDLLISV